METEVGEDAPASIVTFTAEDEAPVIMLMRLPVGTRAEKPYLESTTGSRLGSCG